MAGQEKEKDINYIFLKETIMVYKKKKGCPLYEKRRISRLFFECTYFHK